MNERKQVTEMSHDHRPSTSLPRIPVASATLTATVCSGLLAILSALGPSFSQAATVSASTPAQPTALSARAFSLNESGNLHLTSKQGFTLNEEGPASGTVGGTIYVHLKIVSSTHVSAEVSIYPKGGSITGQGTASYRRQGSSANFSGTLSIERGSGSYDHARGSGLSFSGTIQRSNDAVTVHVSGTASD